MRTTDDGWRHDRPREDSESLGNGPERRSFARRQPDQIVTAQIGDTGRDSPRYQNSPPRVLDWEPAEDQNSAEGLGSNRERVEERPPVADGVGAASASDELDLDPGDGSDPRSTPGRRPTHCLIADHGLVADALDGDRPPSDQDVGPGP
jgi:hypothetical protein